MKKLLCTVIAAVMLVSVCVTASAAGLDELLRDYVGVTYDGHSEDQLARWMLAQAEIDWIYRGYWGDCYEAIRYNGQYVTDGFGKMLLLFELLYFLLAGIHFFERFREAFHPLLNHPGKHFLESIGAFCPCPLYIGHACRDFHAVCHFHKDTSLLNIS